MLPVYNYNLFWILKMLFLEGEPMPSVSTHKPNQINQLPTMTLPVCIPTSTRRHIIPLDIPSSSTNLKTTDLSAYFGIALCTVLPFTELFHPVLPYRYASKLTFPLCRTCAQESIDLLLLEKCQRCSHSPSERALSGTWCTPELECALGKSVTLSPK